MILLFFLLILFCGCGLVIGTFFLTWLDPWQYFDRKDDRIIISIWTGLLVLANLFLIISLFKPLSGQVAISTTLCLLLIALMHRQTRGLIRDIFNSPAPQVLFGTAFLVLGIAAYCSQVIVWFDSGLYHIQMIKWLSEFGLVPGLALIHSRFGIVSSWFTLPAAVNHGLLQGRIASLPGALCLLLLFGHGLAAFFHIIRQDGRNQDFFITTATLLAAPVILVWGMPNSPTPDLPVIVITITTAWALFAIADKGGLKRDDSAVNVTLLPLILAGGALSLKLSAFPLVPVAALFYLFSSRFNARTIAVSGGAVMFFLAPIAAGGILTAGCAFYPSSFFCFDLPWSLGAAMAKTETKIIQDWARWGERFAPADAGPLDWILPWFRSEKVCTVLMILSLLAIVFLVASRRERSLRRNRYIVALAITGTAFMFYAAPTWRFGLGYLVLMPALLVASRDALCRAVAGKLGKIKILHSFAFIGLISGAVIALHVHLLPRPSYDLLDKAVADKIINSSDQPHFNFLYPPRIWNIDYQKVNLHGKTVAYKNIIVQDRTGNLVYFRPADSQVCWDSPLPCAPAELENVRLRRARKGLEGGFEKINPGGGHN